MAKFKKWPWFVFWILTALVATALLGNAYLKIEEKHAGFLFTQSSTSEPTKRMAEHVYFILVDGLRADTLDKMPFTKSLADEGSCGIFTVPGPTFSRPAYARIITGASSSINGISANAQEKKLFAPTLFDLAAGEGLKTGVSAYRWYYDLVLGPPYRTGESDENRLVFGDGLPIQYGYYYDDFSGDYDDEEIFGYGIEAMAEYDPNLLLIHTMEVDEMGHRHGGTSEAYLDAALKNDRCIEKFVGRIPSPEESVIIITGDHGHINGGGHGGLEKQAAEVKVVFAGKGVTAGGVLEGYTQLDLAPTIAALLGLPFTSYMEGRIVADAFTWPEEALSSKKRLLDETHRPLLLELGRQFKLEPTANDDGRSLERLAASVNRRWIILRGLLGAAVVLAMLLWGGRLLRRRGMLDDSERRCALEALAATVLSLLVFVAALYAFGFGYSYSYINQMSDIAKAPLAALTAFSVFLIVHRAFSKKFSFSHFAAASTCLLAATALIAAAAGILQGGVKFFLPQVTFYMIYLLTLAQLALNALLCAVTGAIIGPAEQRRHKISIGG